MQVNITVPDDIKDEHSIKGDLIITNLVNLQPDEISAWVDSHVNTIEDVKSILKKLILIIRYLVKYKI